MIRSKLRWDCWGWKESLVFAGDDDGEGGGDGGGVEGWLSMVVEGMMEIHSPYYDDDNDDGVKDYVGDVRLLMQRR